MSAAPPVVQDWAVWHLDGSNRNRAVVERIAHDTRMKDVWQRLARVPVRRDWYLNHVLGGELLTLPDVLPSSRHASEGDYLEISSWIDAIASKEDLASHVFADIGERERLPFWELVVLSPPDLALVHFAQELLLGTTFHVATMPAKPAKEIQEDWTAIADAADLIANKLELLKIEAGLEQSTAHLIGLSEPMPAALRPLLTSHLLRKLAARARVRAMEDPIGPRKRTPETLARSVVIPLMIKMVDTVFGKPLNQQIATAVEVALDLSSPIDVRQIRAHRRSLS